VAVCGSVLSEMARVLCNNSLGAATPARGVPVVTVRCSTLQRVAVGCSGLQCVAVGCSVSLLVWSGYE